MHPIRRELEVLRFSERLPFRRSRFAHPLHTWGDSEGDCRLGAAGPAARPAPARADGAAFRRHRSGFGFCGLRVRRARIPYRLSATSACTRVSVSRSRLSRRIVISPVVTEMKDETR